MRSWGPRVERENGGFLQIVKIDYPKSDNPILRPPVGMVHIWYYGSAKYLAENMKRTGAHDAP